MFDEQPPQLQKTEISPFILNVDENCIEQGIPQDSENCMLSIALKNSGFENPHVFFDGQLSFYYKGEEYGVKSTPFLKHKIAMFDSFNPVTPFMLKLEPIKGYKPWSKL